MTTRTIALTALKVASAATDLLAGRRPGPRVLIYHQVGAATGLELNVRLERFLDQLKWMREYGQVVHLEATLDGSDGHDSYVITFDDGYADVFHHAFPLLRRHHTPFTLFLTTEPIETGESLRPADDAAPLTWQQVEEMVATGLVTIGAHTHSHPDLRSCSDDRVADEIGRSNDIIERRLGGRPDHFAYPWGYWSGSAHAAVRESYETAFLGSGPPIGSDPDPHLLSRLPVMASDTAWMFRRRMWGGFRLEDRARRMLKGYRGP